MGSAESDAFVITVAAAFGFTIFVLVYTFAGVSGGNFNPAITFALLFTKKISPVRAVCYIIAQMVGSICGAGLAKAVSESRFNQVNGGANIISDGIERQSALLAEIIATSLLTLVVLAAVDNIVQGPRVPHIAVRLLQGKQLLYRAAKDSTQRIGRFMVVCMSDPRTVRHRHGHLCGASGDDSHRWLLDQPCAIVRPGGGRR